MNGMKNILEYIKKEIVAVCQVSSELQRAFVCEYPKNKDHGDFATNIAMTLSKHYKKNPMEIAPILAEKIGKLPFVKEVSVASPGFINMRVKPNLLNEMMVSIYESQKLPNYGNGEKVNVEYVSANPTGPLHVGHLRGAVYGDVLSNLLLQTGFGVTREYYINDAGNQINVLARSVYIRYLQLLGKNVEVEEGCYPAEYIVEIAKEIVQKFGKNLEESSTVFREYAVHYNMEWIKKTMKKLKIHHDVFSSEKEIVNSNAINEAFAELQKKDLIYRGIPPKPHKMEEEDWVPVEQTLFRTSLFGDTDDRVVQKADGNYTYCVPDMIYQRNKILRGFNKLVMVLGADHLGYVTRLKSMTKALATSDSLGGGTAANDFDLDIKICQIVKFLKDGEAFKMSKRAGNFVTVDDLMEDVHPDVLRFIMLTKKNDVHMDFDVEQVKQQTKENPIFYIQYAYSRINSVLRKSSIKTVDFSVGLNNEKFHELVKKMLEFPVVLNVAVKNYEPHHLAFYLYSLAGVLHGVWSAGNSDELCRFIIEGNSDPIKMHNQESVNILFAMKKIFDYTFNVFNVEGLTSM